jgi:hypothetical protein
MRTKISNHYYYYFSTKVLFSENGNGNYIDIRDGKQFIEITTHIPKVVCHFYKRDFQRCTIVDKHLDLISTFDLGIRWIKFDVEKAEFFTKKLHICILPCIVIFLNGLAIDRITGFEELGNIDTFSTKDLIIRLSKSGIIHLKENNMRMIEEALSTR